MFRLAALLFMAVPLLSQTGQTTKPSFDVVSIKPSAPNAMGMRGGGTRGNRYTMTGATDRVLLQQGYREASDGPGQLQLVGEPNWTDSDRYDIQATVDCSGGVLAREQVQLMIQSMLEDRFQLPESAHGNARATHLQPGRWEGRSENQALGRSNATATRRRSGPAMWSGAGYAATASATSTASRRDQEGLSLPRSICPEGP